ncbi:hypothetical protein OSSY52_12690 [Tepiditoga spiralis]|uniref:Uncharacterized protein n=1 Tax=Tepiditoga spiralis TaxID=2108365 RepID=A0A7G1G3V0_9BACT|nr:carboxypeptidase regulatory-like domain-containing protein [Tepiditoga spiralis]BBE31128.1 hypothetical protein OSSY52_12690 [Tepiditoga spiralis]
MKKYIELTILFLIIVLTLTSCILKPTPGTIQGHINLKFSDQLDGTLIKIKGLNTTVKTDKDGNFMIKNLEPKDYTLQISRQDYEEKEIKVNVYTGNIVSVNTSLSFKFGKVLGSVSVLNDEDEINLNFINLDKKAKDLKNKILKGSNTFEYNLMPGKYNLVINSNKYSSYEKEITVVKDKKIELAPIILQSIMGIIEGKIIPQNVNGEDDLNSEKSNFSIKLYNKDTLKVETVTDKNGYFHLNYHEGTYTIKIVKKNYITQTIEVNIYKNKTNSLSNIKMFVGGENKGWIKGKVYLEDRKNNENSGIGIIFKPLNSENIVQTTITDKDGNYNSLLDVGKYEVEISKENYTSVSTQVNVEEYKISSLQSVELKRKSTLVEGYVKLPGSLDNSGAIVQIGDFSETTNKDGYYKIISKTGVQDIKVTKENYIAYSDKLNVLDLDKNKFDLILEPLKSSIEGFAKYNIESINNQEGITVTIEGTSLDLNNKEINVFFTTKTDKNGYYKIINVPFGKYKISYSAQGFSTVVLNNLEIYPNQKKTIEKIIFLEEIPTTGSVYGKAYLKNSKDMSGINVLAKKHNGPGYITVTDINGTYVFPKISSGIYDLEFSKFSYKTYVIKDVKVNIGDKINIKDSPILEKASGKIIGTVKLEGWNNSKDIKIELLGDYEKKLGYRLYTYTDENGNFELEAPVSQNYTGLRVYKNEDFEDYTYSDNFQTTETTPYKPIFEKTSDTPLILKAIKNTVKGKVTIANFTNNLNIEVELKSKTSDATYLTYTNKEGIFEFQHIPLGTYIQKSSFPQCGYVLSPVDVIPGNLVQTNDVTLFPNAGEVTGKVNLKNVTDNSKVSITLIPFDTNVEKMSYNTITNENGNYTFGSILHGKYKLIAKKDGWNENKIDSLEVKSFKTTTVPTLELSDTIPPIINKVLINGGSSTTDNTKVIITTFAKDVGSGLYQISISNDKNQENWMKYEYQKIYDLDSTEGEKTIYVKVKDNSENISEMKTASTSLIHLPNATNLTDYLHGKIVTKDTVITKAQSPYYVSDSILVNENVKLTIEAGVVLIFKNNTNIIINGFIEARGTNDEKIVFKPENIDDVFNLKVNSSSKDIQNKTMNKRNFLKSKNIFTSSLKDMINSEMKRTIKYLKDKQFKTVVDNKTIEISNNLKSKNLYNKINKEYSEEQTNTSNILENIDMEKGNLEIENGVIKNLTGNSLKILNYVEIYNSNLKILDCETGMVKLINSNILSSFNLSGYITDSNLVNSNNHNYALTNSYVKNSSLTGNFRINNSIVEDSSIEFSKNDYDNTYIQNSKISNSKISKLSDGMNENIRMNIASSILISNTIKDITIKITGTSMMNNENNFSYFSYIIYNNIFNEHTGIEIGTNKVLLAYNNFIGQIDFAIKLMDSAKNGNIESKNNYFGTDNIEQIKNKIYDYDDDPNFSLSRVNFEPYETKEINSISEIQEITSKELSGNLYLNYKLTKNNSPYVVTDNLSIFGKLIIEPGVEIKVNKDKKIDIYGSIEAGDVDKESINFYTNTGVMAKDMWYGITFYNTNEKSIKFENVIIDNTITGITLQNASVKLNKLTIKQTTTGIQTSGNSNLTLINSNVQNSTSNDIEFLGNTLKINDSKVNKLNLNGGNNNGSYQIEDSKFTSIVFMNSIYKNVYFKNINTQSLNMNYIYSNIKIENSIIGRLYNESISNGVLYVENSKINSFSSNHMWYNSKLIIKNNEINFFDALCDMNNNFEGKIIIQKNKFKNNFFIGMNTTDSKNQDGYDVDIFNNTFDYTNSQYQNGEGNVIINRLKYVSIHDNIFKNGVELKITNDKTTKIYDNTFKDNNYDTLIVDGELSMPEIYNNTFYGNNNYAVVVRKGLIAGFKNNYIALNFGGVKIENMSNNINLSENIIMMNRYLNLENNSNYKINLSDNFWGLYTEESIKETIMGSYEMESFKTKLIEEAGSSEKPDIGELLSYTNLKDYILNNDTLKEEDSPYLVTSDIDLNNMIFEGNIEIKISDGRKVIINKSKQKSGTLTFSSVYERNEASNITKVINNSKLNDFQINGISLENNNDIGTLLLNNGFVNGKGIIEQLNTSGTLNTVDVYKVMNADISTNFISNNSNFDTVNLKNVNNAEFNLGKILKLNTENVKTLKLNSESIENIVTTTVDNLYLNNVELNKAKISNAKYLESNSKIEESNFKDIESINLFNANVFKSTFDNSPVLLSNTKLFNNTIKNANIGLTIKEANDEDSVYIMKNVFDNNTEDIKSNVSNKINAQYNYFVSGTPNISGNIDVSNSLSETPNDEEVALNHEISGKIILNSVLKASDKDYKVTDNLIIIGRLRVEPGVNIKIKEGKKIEVRGSLIVEGTKEDNVFIKPDTSILIKDKWSGFDIKAGGTLTLKYAVTGYASTLINNFGTVNVENSKIKLNTIAFNQYENSSSSILNSKISSNDSVIKFSNNSEEFEFNIDNCNFYSNSSFIDIDNEGYSDKAKSYLNISNSKISSNSFEINRLNCKVQNTLIKTSNFNLNSSNFESDFSTITYIDNMSMNVYVGSDTSVVIKNSYLNTLNTSYSNNIIINAENSTFTNINFYREYNNKISIENCKVSNLQLDNFSGILNVNNGKIGHLRISGTIKGNINFNNILFEKIDENYNNLIEINSNYPIIFNNIHLNGNNKNTDGIFISNDAMIGFKNSIFENCSKAINIEKGALLYFDKNKIINNSYGIYIKEFPSEDVELQITNNEFNNTHYNIYNETKNKVIADDNYWNTLDETTIKNKIYNVVVSKWLSESPIN